MNTNSLQQGELEEGNEYENTTTGLSNEVFDGNNTIKRKYKEKLESFPWVERFKIIDGHDRGNKTHLEIVCKIGKVPCTDDIVKLFGDRNLSFITYKELSNTEWFETHILDENCKMKEEYARELLRLEWVETFHLSEESDDRRHVEIVCKFGKAPQVPDIVNIFGESILTFIGYRNAEKDESFEEDVLDENYESESDSESERLFWLRKRYFKISSSGFDELKIDVDEQKSSSYERFSWSPKRDSKISSSDFNELMIDVDEQKSSSYESLFERMFLRTDPPSFDRHPVDKIRSAINTEAACIKNDEGSKNKWFEENVLNENYDIKDVYVHELRSGRFSWIKNFYIGADKETKSWQMCITYAGNAEPCMQDLKMVFGDNIASFAKFTPESDAKSISSSTWFL